eukprot:SAG31_NODE_35626_length_321_cov_0.914414_1_plen_80_part_01
MPRTPDINIHDIPASFHLPNSDGEPLRWHLHGLFFRFSNASLILSCICSLAATVLWQVRTFKVQSEIDLIVQFCDGYQIT